MGFGEALGLGPHLTWSLPGHCTVSPSAKTRSPYGTWPCNPDSISIVFETTKLPQSRHPWSRHASSGAPERKSLPLKCLWIATPLSSRRDPRVCWGHWPAPRSSVPLQLFGWFCTWSPGACLIWLGSLLNDVTSSPLGSNSTFIIRMESLFSQTEFMPFYFINWRMLWGLNIRNENVCVLLYLVESHSFVLQSFLTRCLP